MDEMLDRLAARHLVGRWAAPFHELFVRAYGTPMRPFLRAFFRRSDPSAVVFVVGCYNSGTTLYRDLIRCHPTTSGPPVEGDLLTSHLGTLEDGGYPRGLYANARTIVAAERDRPLDRDALLSDWRPWIESGSTLVEKSVSNSMRIPRLREAFPGARFVWVLRDPFEVAEGIRRRSRPSGGGEYPAEFLLRQWLFFNETIGRDIEPDLTLQVTYGRLISDPVGVARRLFEFAALREVPVEGTPGGLLVGRRLLRIRGGREAPVRGSPASDHVRWTSAVHAALATGDLDLSRMDRGAG